MKIYLVGGAVRDKLLGLPIKERDWVVVGAQAEDMLRLGFRQVGKDFPVFLHPKTNEEYALARIERKTQPGYTGFQFDTSLSVTLEEDLLRRDLTINAMAESTEGELIDPYHGQEDLRNKILRHVSPAFTEDPVRILRIARFSARYAQLGFHIAPETLQLMQSMVESGEINSLVAERVWKELERALAEPHPEQFFLALAHCHALSLLFPHLEPQGKGMQALVACRQLSASSEARFAALVYALPEEALPEETQAINKLCERYRIPHHYRDLARLTQRYYATALAALSLDAHALVTLLYALDAFRRKDRFTLFLSVCHAIAAVEAPTLDIARIIQHLQRVKIIAAQIDIKNIIASGLTGPDLATAIKLAREKAINAAL